jgi:hypothetical protein
MKKISTLSLCGGLLLLQVGAQATEVYRCGEPKGMAMWSDENHKISSDGYKGVQPVTIIEEREMRIIWGDSKTLTNGQNKVWRAAIVQRTNDSVSAVAVDGEAGSSATMLFTMNFKQGYLYMSSHKSLDLIGTSTASTFYSKCTW